MEMPNKEEKQKPEKPPVSSHENTTKVSLTRKILIGLFILSFWVFFAGPGIALRWSPRWSRQNFKMHPGSYKLAPTPLTMLRIDCACRKNRKQYFLV